MLFLAFVAANDGDHHDHNLYIRWVLTILACGVLSILYWTLAYWKRRADMIMALPGNPVYSNGWLGDLSEMLQQPKVPHRPQNQDLWSYFVRLCKEYQSHGAARLVAFSPYRLPFMSTPILFLLDPDLVRACIQHPACQQKGYSYEVSSPMIDHSVLVAPGTGSSWRRQRKLTARAFSNHVMERMTAKTAQLLQDVVYPKFLDSSVNEETGGAPKTVELVDLMSRFALEALGEVAFSKSFGGLVTPTEEEKQGGQDRTLYKLFDEIMVGIDQQGRSGGLQKILPIRWDVFSNVRRLNRTIDELIQERVRDGKDLGQYDLLSNMLEKDEKGKFVLSQQELLGNAKTFLFAGHDTTSASLVMALYELSKHPKVVSRLREEIDPLFVSDDDTKQSRDPTYSDLRSLPLLDKVIRETLRMHPPAMFGRTGSCDFVLETSKYRYEIPKGTEIVIAPWIIQRLAWDDGEVWNPDRKEFDRGSKSSFDVGAYFPFAIGARNCVGRELALAEIRAVLAHMVHDFDFVPPKEDVVTFTRMTLNPNQCRMGFVRRSATISEFRTTRS